MNLYYFLGCSLIDLLQVIDSPLLTSYVLISLVSSLSAGRYISLFHLDCLLGPEPTDAAPCSHTVTSEISSSDVTILEGHGSEV